MAPSPDLSKFTSTVDSIDQSSFPDEDERHEAIRAARRMITRLEKPWDTLLYYCWNTPNVVLALKIMINLGVFKELDAGPKSAAELAKAVGAEEDLIDRVLRHLAANDMAIERAPSTYESTPLTREIAQNVGGSAVEFLYDFGWKCALTLPEYLQKTGYKVPKSAVDGNFQVALNTDKPFFGPGGWLATKPSEAKRFQELMIGYTSQRQTWVEVYPTEELLDGAGADETLVVDVGGNAGEDLAQFLAKHPEAADRVVLQDLGEVLGLASVPQGIKPMAHDFFTPQPVQGARAYFMHSILHDWPDADCLRILNALRPAFGPHSRLLFSDHVIRPMSAASHQTALDLIMMSALGAQERTQPDWERLLTQAGFKLKKVHPGRLESVVEAWPM